MNIGLYKLLKYKEEKKGRWENRSSNGQFNYIELEFQKEKREEIFELIIAKKFQKVMKEINEPQKVKSER